jgi:predicted nucleic acid-binding protein
MEPPATNAIDGMKLIITDVSVLFDLFQINLLKEFFELDVEICTTIFVYNEIVSQEQLIEFEQFKLSKKLKVLELSSNEIEEVVIFKTKRNLKSIPDKTILWKAIQLNCPLLTCDCKLKKEANDNGIEVHGSIWVLTELARQKIIEKQQTVQLLEQLKVTNSRLPVTEIDKIIRKLSSN